MSSNVNSEPPIHKFYKEHVRGASKTFTIKLESVKILVCSFRDLRAQYSYRAGEVGGHDTNKQKGVSRFAASRAVQGSELRLFIMPARAHSRCIVTMAFAHLLRSFASLVRGYFKSVPKLAGRRRRR